MYELNQALLILHFFGLAMGLAVPLSNFVLQGLILKAPPQEKDILARVPPAMARTGDTGLVLLWATGLVLVFTKWGGFGSLPWQFEAKMVAVVILTGLVGYIHTLMRRARTGDTAAAARIPSVGRLASLAAVAAVVLAVLTFD